MLCQADRRRPSNMAHPEGVYTPLAPAGGENTSSAGAPEEAQTTGLRPSLQSPHAVPGVLLVTLGVHTDGRHPLKNLVLSVTW